MREPGCVRRKASFARTQPTFQAIHRAIGRCRPRALGEVDWHAPPWAVDCRPHPLRSAGRRTRTAAPTPDRDRAGATCSCWAAPTAGWRWYENRPRPIETTFTVTPRLTCYECEPPGKPNPLLVTFNGSAAPLAQTGKDLDPKFRPGQMIPP
jgi:hypothetical protein